MSQLLIIQGENPDAAGKLFRRAVAAFEVAGGLRPVETRFAGSTSVAVFPHLKAPTTGIMKTEEEWICGAGCWFMEGAAGEDGLRRLLRHPQRSTPEAWLQEADGIFAVALYELASGRVLLVTDRLGSLHVYRAQVGPCLAISTSSQVLAALLRPAWDVVGCREFLATGTVFESRTLFRGIEKLPPATVFELVRGKEASRRKYWNVADAMYDRAAERGSVPKLAAALEESVATVGRCYARPLMDLTGGFDSRAVLGAVLRSGNRFDTVVNGGDNDPDVVASKAIAEKMQLRHRHNPRGFRLAAEWWRKTKEALPVCDGEYDALLYAGTFATHQRMANEYDATVNGSNGEICKGYWWELLFPHTRSRRHFDARKVAAGRFVFDGEVPDLLAQPFEESLADLFAGIIERANAGLEKHPNTAKMDNVYLTLRMQRWQGRIASSTSRIWPCIMPFAFRRPMEVALSATPFRRLRNRMSRRLLEYQNAELAALPLAEGYPAVPLRLTTAHQFWPQAVDFMQKVRRKLGWGAPAQAEAVSAASHYPFPFAELWKEEEVRDLLEPRRMVSRELYNGSTLAALLEESRQKSFARAHRVARILTIEMLARAIRAGS